MENNFGLFMHLFVSYVDRVFFVEKKPREGLSLIITFALLLLPSLSLNVHYGNFR
jgi:hypothetical protein